MNGGGGELLLLGVFFNNYWTVYIDCLDLRWLCVGGQLGRILGCPWDPLDCLEGCVCETSREDPDIPLDSIEGCMWEGGQLGRILGCPWDPPDSMEGCVCGDN